MLNFWPKNSPAATSQEKPAKTNVINTWMRIKKSTWHLHALLLAQGKNFGQLENIYINQHECLQ